MPSFPLVSRCLQGVYSGFTLAAVVASLYWYGSKFNHQETAGFSPGFHLPGFYVGYLFLIHTHFPFRETKKPSREPAQAMSTGSTTGSSRQRRRGSRIGFESTLRI